MNRITLEIDMDKLSVRGHEALKVLMDDLAKPAGSAVQSQTIELLAEKIYKRLARKDSMRGVLDKLLDNTKLTYAEVCEAAGQKAGGPGLAGVLSSITRNWQRYGGMGRLIDANETNDGEWIYQLVDAGMLEPLRKARENFKKTPKS